MYDEISEDNGVFMLYLTRAEGECILVYPGDIPDGMTVAELFADEAIEIRVKQIAHGGHQVKIGVHAPLELTVLREELAE